MNVSVAMVQEMAWEERVEDRVCMLRAIRLMMTVNDKIPKVFKRINYRNSNNLKPLVSDPFYCMEFPFYEWVYEGRKLGIRLEVITPNAYSDYHDTFSFTRDALAISSIMAILFDKETGQTQAHYKVYGAENDFFIYKRMWDLGMIEPFESFQLADELSEFVEDYFS